MFSVYAARIAWNICVFRALYGYTDNSCFVLVAKEKLDFWFFKTHRKT